MGKLNQLTFKILAGFILSKLYEPNYKTAELLASLELNIALENMKKQKLKFYQRLRQNSYTNSIVELQAYNYKESYVWK